MKYRKIHLSWREYRRHLKNLIKKIQKSKFSPDAIVCIARGGLVLGVQLSHFFNIKFFTLYYRHTKSDRVYDYRKDVKFEGGILGRIKGKKVLLVDEIAGSGETIQKAIKRIKLKKPKEIKTVVMIIDQETLNKTHKINLIDFYSMKTNSKEWVVFPWEEVV